MSRLRNWFDHHPPSVWVRLLEWIVKLLNILLALAGLIVVGWSIATCITISKQGVEDGGLTAARLRCPWFVIALGVVGGATSATAMTAVCGTYLRSLACMGFHVFLMCQVLTGQACVAVACFMDKTWEERLPDIDEKIKAYLAERLEVCKWVGVGLFLVQLLMLLSSCLLHSVYVGLEEQAEDEAEDAALRRAPLLQHQQHQEASRATNRSRAVAATASAQEVEGWRQHMQEQYGLDTSVFVRNSVQPDTGTGGNQAQSRTCSIM